MEEYNELVGILAHRDKTLYQTRVVCAANRITREDGKNMVGLCPFHEEKNPSFSVSIEMQFYFCFGCGESGNALHFIQKFDKVNFIEALSILKRGDHNAINSE